jgi:hypothetical protein
LTGVLKRLEGAQMRLSRVLTILQNYFFASL